ncbi:MAG: SH3 domain-containing protein [Anaerolineaceae bacterium]|nr:SH3 domain-containing protein [Anaerolineaceae bacterium]
MSIPITETEPDGLHSASRVQSRQVRKMLEISGPSQIEDFLNDLINRNQLNSGYLGQLLLSLVMLSVGLIADLPLLVLVSAVTAPVLNPMIGLVVSAVRPSLRHMGKSVAYLLITVLAFFALAWLMMLISPAAIRQDQLSGFFAINDSWLEWLVIVFTSLFSAYLYLYRRGGPSVLTSTVLAYLIFIPLTLAGLFLAQGESAQAASLLVLIAARLAISILVMLISVWAFRFSPKGSLGWLFLAIMLIASALAIVELRFSQPSASAPQEDPISEVVVMPTNQPTKEPLPTQLPSRPTLTSTQPAQPTAIAQLTPTAVPTSTARYARVISESGVVVREFASTQAAIITYINNGLQVTLLGEQANDQSQDWEKVIAPDGKEGWVAARFLAVINP